MGGRLTTEEYLHFFSGFSREELDEALVKAKQQLKEWRKTCVEETSTPLVNARNKIKALQALKRG